MESKKEKELQAKMNTLLNTLPHNFEQWDKLVELKAPLCIMMNQIHLIHDRMFELVSTLAFLQEHGIILNENGLELLDELCTKATNLPKDELEVLYMFLKADDNSPYAEENKKHYQKQIEELILNEATDIINEKIA